MSVKEMIENEIALEEKILKKYQRQELTGGLYLLCKESGGRKRFYFKNKRTGTIQYVNRNEMERAKHLLESSVHNMTRETLKKNIQILKETLGRICDYDNQAIIKLLPAAYSKFAEELLPVDAGELQDSFPQSENPKDRGALKVKTSFNLMVRSKNELIIAEELYYYGLKFWYEKGLEIIISKKGTYNSEIIYPDFTVELEDNSLMFWEHFGMMDKPEYQEKNYLRLQKYLSNGIYPPKNLILTFDGENMPFDNNGVKRIIERDLIRKK